MMKNFYFVLVLFVTLVISTLKLNGAKLDDSETEKITDFSSFLDLTFSRMQYESKSPDEINYSNEIAIRKLIELNRESVTQVEAMIPEFLNRTMENAHDQQGECIDWYAAMQSVVSRQAMYLSIGGKDCKHP